MAVAIKPSAGLTPELLSLLSGYLLGEILELRSFPSPGGYLGVVVRFLDTEACDWNAEVEASDMSDEEKADSRWADEIFVHRYIVDPSVSRVIEVRDEWGALIERDPLPWSQRTEEPRIQQRSAPRQRPSALAEQAISTS